MRTNLNKNNFDMGHFHYISPWKWKYHPFRFKEVKIQGFMNPLKKIIEYCGNGKAHWEKNPHCNKQKIHESKGNINLLSPGRFVSYYKSQCFE